MAAAAQPPARLAYVAKHARDLAVQLNELNTVTVSISSFGGGGGESKASRLAMREAAIRFIAAAHESHLNTSSLDEMSDTTIAMAADAIGALATVPDELSSTALHAASLFARALGSAVANGDHDVGPDVVDHVADAIGRLHNCLTFAVEDHAGAAVTPPPPSPPPPPQLPQPPPHLRSADDRYDAWLAEAASGEASLLEEVTVLPNPRVLEEVRRFYRSIASLLIEASSTLLQSATQYWRLDEARYESPPMLSGPAGATAVLSRIIDGTCDGKEATFPCSAEMQSQRSPTHS